MLYEMDVFFKVLEKIPIFKLEIIFIKKYILLIEIFCIDLYGSIRIFIKNCYGYILRR